MRIYTPGVPPDARELLPVSVFKKVSELRSPYPAGLQNITFYAGELNFAFCLRFRTDFYSLGFFVSFDRYLQHCR